MIHLDRVEVTVETLEAAQVTRRTILGPICLELAERRIVVIGANGSGKSTLLRLINGLNHPSRGQVRIDDLDPQRDGAAVRRAVGFIFTDPMSQLVMATGVDDVELSLRRTIKDRRLRRARALELLARQGLAEVAESSVHDLSGGERQLVALTSVLAVQPRLVVADEPTTLLDLRNKHRVQRALLALDQQVVVATHDLEFALDFERAVVIDQGRVVADGDPREAVAHYRALMA